jgi:hypothetical protein
MLNHWLNRQVIDNINPIRSKIYYRVLVNRSTLLQVLDNFNHISVSVIKEELKELFDMLKDSGRYRRNDI